MFLLFSFCGEPEYVILLLRQACVAFSVVCVKLFGCFRTIAWSWCISTGVPSG